MTLHGKKGTAPFLVILAACLVLLFPGTPECANGATQKVLPGTVSLCLGGAPGVFPLLAHDQGFFATEGVTVILKKYRTTTEGLEHFFKGECDLTTISETAIVMKSFERRDFSILATFATSDDATYIVASRKSGINAPQDLKGKRIFVPQWSSNHFFLAMYLARYGMSQKDLTLVVSNVPDISAALKAGDIDACCASEVIIAKPRRDLGDDAIVFNAPGLYMASYSLAGWNRLIKADPAVIKKVVAAMLKTEKWIKKNRAAAVKVAAASQNLEEPVMASIWDKYRWEVQLSQTLIISLEQEAQWAIRSGFTTASMPNYLDFVFIEALRSLDPAAARLIK